MISRPAGSASPCPRCPCGKFFRPAGQSKARQKCCSNGECQRRRKAISQREWCRKNPHYFEGRYDYLRQWRKNNPNYQKEWRKCSAIKNKLGDCPAVAGKDEIQDLEPVGSVVKPVILLKKPVLFSVPVDEIQDEIQDAEKKFNLNCTLIIRGYRISRASGSGHEIQDHLAQAS